MLNKKVISTLLSAFIVCLAIGTFLSKPDNKDLLKQMFAQKVHSNKKYDLVVAGDSRVYRGVSTNIIGEQLNMPSLNLGFSSAGFNKTIYDLIEKKLSKKPGNIIILGITPFSLTDQAIVNGHIKRINKLKNEEVLEYLYLKPIKNIFTPTDPIKIWTHVFNDPKSNRYVQKVNVDEGWVASDYHNPNRYYALKSYKKTMSGTKISNNTIENLYTKIRYWTSEGFLVFGYIPPSSENMEELERQYTKFDDYGVVKGFVEAGGKWISLNDTYTSYDGSHLNIKSSMKLSYEIANTIKSKTYLTGINEKTKIRYVYNQLKSKYIFHNDFENKAKNTWHTDIAHSGNSVLVSDSNLKYLDLFQTKTNFIVNKKINKVSVDMYIYYEDENTSAKIIIDIMRDDNSIQWKGLELSYIVKPKNWGNINFQVSVPENITDMDKLKVYVINSGKTRILIDDFILNMY